MTFLGKSAGECYAPKYINRSTGPTQVPEGSLNALGEQVISHRSPDFRRIYEDTTNNLQSLVNCQTRPVVLCGSGTGALEAAISSILRHADKILVLSCGYYGDLLAQIILCYTDNMDLVRFAPGTAIDEESVEQLAQKQDYDIVLFTHSESSTGVLNPVGELIRVIRRYQDPIIVIDAVSSLGTVEIDMLELGVDILVSCSQKGLMSPPGIGICFLSARAVDHIRAAPKRTLYLNLQNYIDKQSEMSVPFTPPVNALKALNNSLNLMLVEGLERVYERHTLAQQVSVERIEGRGLSLFADKAHSAPAISTIRLPAGITSTEIIRKLHSEHNTTVSSGLSDWKDNIIRIGHMGFFTVPEIASNVENIIDVIQSIQR